MNKALLAKWLVGYKDTTVQGETDTTSKIQENL